MSKNPRKVHLQDQEWRYRLGKGNAVIISPNGKKTVVDYSALTGLDWNAIERGMWKRYFMVTPAIVKSYIQANLEKLT